MYESPIELLVTEIQHQIVKQQDEEIYKAVLNYVPNVDKEELIRALKYDRNQYDKGYADAKAESGWIPVTERLPDIKKVIDGEVYYRNVAVRVKNLLHERIAYYDPEHECWYDTGFFQIRGVTHWCELPEWEPPKGE